MKYLLFVGILLSGCAPSPFEMQVGNCYMTTDLNCELKVKEKNRQLCVVDSFCIGDVRITERNMLCEKGKHNLISLDKCTVIK